METPGTIFSVKSLTKEKDIKLTKVTDGFSDNVSSLWHLPCWVALVWECRKRGRQLGEQEYLAEQEYSAYFSWEKTVKSINCASGHESTAGCQGQGRHFLMRR